MILRRQRYFAIIEGEPVYLGRHDGPDPAKLRALQINNSQDWEVMSQTQWTAFLAQALEVDKRADGDALMRPDGNPVHPQSTFETVRVFEQNLLLERTPHEAYVWRDEANAYIMVKASINGDSNEWEIESANYSQSSTTYQPVGTAQTFDLALMMCFHYFAFGQQFGTFEKIQ